MYNHDLFTPKMPYKGFSLSRSTDSSTLLSVEKGRDTQFGLGGMKAGEGSLPAWLMVHGPTRQSVSPPSLDIIALSQDQVSSSCVEYSREKWD
jgi:hypothetical protein